MDLNTWIFTSCIGSGGSGPGKFQNPCGFAIDPNREGQLIVADTGNDRVQVMTAHGNYMRLIGGTIDKGTPEIYYFLTL